MSAWSDGPTHWSVLLQSQDDRAWEYFFRRYQSAVTAYFRRRGVQAHELEDLVQEFFLRTLQRDFLGRAHPSQGRFRGYLATASQRFLISHWRAQGSAKRKADVVSLDEGIQLGAQDTSPEEAFDLAWAQGVFARATEHVERVFRERGKPEHVQAFALKQAGHTWPQLAEHFATSAPTVRGWVTRVSEQMASAIRREVGGTVPNERELEEELAYLSQVLARAKSRPSP